MIDSIMTTNDLFLFISLIALLLVSIIFCYEFKSNLNKFRNIALFVILIFLLLETIIAKYLSDVALKGLEMSKFFIFKIKISYHIIFISILVILAFLLKMERKKDTIDRNSIKEAIDNIPVGICFYDKTGKSLLINRVMNRIIFSFSGTYINNIEYFLALLENNKLDVKKIFFKDSIAYKIKGQVFLFDKSTININGVEIFQVIVHNITDLYAKTEKLEEERLKIQNQKKSLEKLLKDIVKINRSKEILISKSKLHHEFGKSVLATKLYFKNSKDSQDNFEYINFAKNQWIEVIRKIENNLAEEPKSNLYDELVLGAKSFGCKVVLSGDIKDGNELPYIFIFALKESITNAVRHSNADEVNLNIIKSENKLSGIIRDNGYSEVSEIKEGVGFSSLRKRIEQNGGTFEIKINNGVELHISLNLSEDYYDKSFNC